MNKTLFSKTRDNRQMKQRLETQWQVEQARVRGEGAAGFSKFRERERMWRRNPVSPGRQEMSMAREGAWAVAGRSDGRRSGTF